MTMLKQEALSTLRKLYDGNAIGISGYESIRAGIEEIETIRDRDERLEELWSRFGDVPMDPETERIEEPFMDWGAGVDREEIWHWFDERHSRGVAYLLYGDGIDRTDVMARMVYLKQLCVECGSHDCLFCHDGECRFAMVHERKPRISDEDGCADYAYRERNG